MGGDLLVNLLFEDIKNAKYSGTLYLIRHGTTAFNEENEQRIRGWLDIPLDENGVKAAQTTAKFLKSKKIDRIVTSDLMRCVQTAELIVKELELPIIKDFNLRPWNVGNATGTLIKDVIPTLNHYMKNAKDEIPGGESYGEFYNRWKRAIEKYMAKCVLTQENICLVTHSRNLYCLDHILSGGKMEIRVDGKPDPGGVIELKVGSTISAKEIH